MKINFYVFLIVSFASLMTGNLISQASFGQSDKDLQDKEKFLELGEEKFREDCYKNLNSDNQMVEEFMKDLAKDLPKDFAKESCVKVR
jgi:hypothetical protein